jgi:hypothetical protein
MIFLGILACALPAGYPTDSKWRTFWRTREVFVKKEIKAVFEFARVEELIQHGDANKLLAIVMRLTRGSVSPVMVMDAIEEAKLAERRWSAK